MPPTTIEREPTVVELVDLTWCDVEVAVALTELVLTCDRPAEHPGMHFDATYEMWWLDSA